MFGVRSGLSGECNQTSKVVNNHLMKNEIDILIVGVGGQGILFASELLSEVAMKASYDVKKSEVHGMAQRGGVVSSHVRIGQKVYSPLIQEGEADILLAFEPAEALRWMHFIKKDGFVVTDEKRLVPPIASQKGYHYPDEPIESVQKRIQNVQSIHATEKAEKLGDVRVANTILLGMLSKYIEIPESVWEEAIRERLTEHSAAINIEAFHLGRNQT
jgi:indolepyruvate ferredoxin oxidoreductase beta subunit